MTRAYFWGVVVPGWLTAIAWAAVLAMAFFWGPDLKEWLELMGVWG